MRRKRDPQFLYLAAFAGLGGVLALGGSIALPVWSWAHGGHAQPTFFFFGLWGIAALCGAAANIAVYRQTGDPPEKPPRGGQRIASVHTLDVRSGTPASVDAEQRRAA